MRKLKLPKIKFKIKLPILLWVIFLIVVLVEAFVLYTTLYIASRDSSEEATEFELGAAVRLNTEAYDRTIEWLESSEAYTLESYDLTGGDFGRENPFLE